MPEAPITDVARSFAQNADDPPWPIR